MNDKLEIPSKRILNKLSAYLDVLIIIVAYIVTNSTAFGFVWQFPNFSDPTEAAWSLVGVSGCVILLALVQIKILTIGGEIKQAWRSQIPLILFVIYSVCTLFWSTYFLASVYELSQFIFATLIGVYMAVRFKPEKVFKIIVYYSVFSILASALLLIFDPSLARIDNAFFQGAWRGIYWHRNHLGSLMAFFSTILLLELAMNKHRLWLSISLFVCFIMAAIMVFGSRSATGILVFFILNGMFILARLWLKFQHHLTKKHYMGLAVFFGLALVLALANIEKIFSLLGRNSTLTGRVPVWIDLLTRIWVQKPILGFGFGALWNQEAFRLSMTSFHKWGYMMYFSDNGFLDILLNTGLDRFIDFPGIFCDHRNKKHQCFYQVKEPDFVRPPNSFFVCILGKYLVQFPAGSGSICLDAARFLSRSSIPNCIFENCSK